MSAEKTVDADLLKRIDFSKTKFYAIECRACDLKLGDRCQWSTHCKTAPHKRAAELYRHLDIKYYEMKRGVMEDEPARLCLRCTLCLRSSSGGSKKGTALRPHLFEQHNSSEKHKRAVSLAIAASSGASSSLH